MPKVPPDRLHSRELRPRRANILLGNHESRSVSPYDRVSGSEFTIGKQKYRSKVANHELHMGVTPKSPFASSLAAGLSEKITKPKEQSVDSL